MRRAGVAWALLLAAACAGDDAPAGAAEGESGGESGAGDLTDDGGDSGETGSDSGDGGPALPFPPAGPDAAPDPSTFGPYPVGVLFGDDEV